MKRFFGLAVLALAFTSCQEQAKIGFIDNGDVINEYQEKKDIEEKYKGKDEVFKKKTDSIGQAYNLEVQALQISLQKASPKKQQEASQEFQQKWQIVQQQMQFEKQQMQQAFNAEIDSVITKVYKFVEDYGKKNGYSYILGKNEAGSVIFGGEANDLTKSITDGLNAEYKK